MKQLFYCGAFLAGLTFCLLSGPARAQDDSGDDQGASFQTFYDQLGDQDGTWVQTDDYGYAFQPNVSDPNWAPYTNGNWVYTQDGWTWVSDEPWGWATYHYGRWANIDGLGWVWVPGHRWAPAWVSWRYGGGYAGWAPLPPDAVYQGDDYHFGNDVDVSFNIGAGYYNFVPVGDLGAPNIGRVIINRYNNYTVINHTKNITNITVHRSAAGARNGFGGVVVYGPSLATVNAHAQHHIPTVQLTTATGPGRSSLHGKSLSLYAPRINAATRQQARPAAVSQHISNPTFNRGASVTQPMQVTSSVRPAAPSAAVIRKAQQAQSQAPTSANIPRHIGTPAGAFHPAASNTPSHTTEISPANTAGAFHPAASNTPNHTTETSPANTGGAFHPENKPAPTYHPQPSNNPEFNQSRTPQETHQAPPTFHPQSSPSAPQVNHPQPQNRPAPAPPSHPAPVNHPAPPPSHPAPAPTATVPGQKPPGQ